MIKVMFFISMTIPLALSFRSYAKATDYDLEQQDLFMSKEIVIFNNTVNRYNVSNSYIIEKQVITKPRVNLNDFVKQMNVEDRLKGAIPSISTVIEICNRLGHNTPECHTAIIRHNYSIPYGTDFEVINEKQIKSAGRIMNLN